MDEEIIGDLLDLEYQHGFVEGVGKNNCDVCEYVVEWLDFLVELSEKYKLDIDNVYVDGDGCCFRRNVDVVDDGNYLLVEEMCFGIYLDLREFLITLYLS